MIRVVPDSNSYVEATLQQELHTPPATTPCLLLTYPKHHCNSASGKIVKLHPYQ